MKWLCIVLVWPIFLSGQDLSTSELTESRQTRYGSVLSQNDLYQPFLRSDKYFTNGISAEYADQFLYNGIAKRLLVNLLKKGKSEYAISFSQDMYTPENQNLYQVDSTDIPYSGLLYLTYTRHSNDIKKGSKFISKLYLGVQGPAAGAGEVQNWVHKYVSDDPSVRGWQHQIGNGLILDYQMIHMKMLPVRARHVEISTMAVARVGTLFNYAQLGLSMKLGWFNYSFLNFDGLFNVFSKKGSYELEDIRWSQKRKGNARLAKKPRTVFVNRDFQIYTHLRYLAEYMFYDGTVQGSLIPFEESPYLYSGKELEHFSGNFAFGITMNYRRFSIQYERVTRRDVFKGEGLFGWGNIRVMASF